MKGQTIPYSAAELLWIKENREMPRKEAHALFCATFDRADVSLVNYNAICKRRRWATGRSGCFQRDQVPHNKGKKGWCPPGSKKGWFKSGTVPPNITPMWTERVGKDGYIEMKVPQPNPYTGHGTRYMHKHRWNWEAVNGPLPHGMALKSLDGDRANTSAENWEAVPRALLPRLSGGRWNKPYANHEPALRPTVIALARLEHAVREARKE
jgi:hypothetical protein